MVEALEAGLPVVIPTDTVYGLAALATDADAVAALFALKRRPVDAQIAALVADVVQAEELVELGEEGRVLADAFWPGALTIVATRRPAIELAIGDQHTVGVRCPANDLIRSIARLTGPVATTSANRHGRPAPSTAEEIAELFPSVGVVIDAGPLSGAASTVVSVVGGSVVVLREGPVTAGDIDAVVGGRS